VLEISPKTSDSQDLKSSGNIQCIDKNDEKSTKLWSQKHRQEMEPDRALMIHQHEQAGSQKEKKEREASQKPSRT
jgi:hypothetical protein